MILLTTTAHPTLFEHPGPNGDATHPCLGRLLQPRHTSSCETTARMGIEWACDNDAFVPPEIAADLGDRAFDEGKQRRFMQMLERVADLPGCRFVAVPDMVANAAATARMFEVWQPFVADAGQPIAMVAQDGLSEVGVPWDAIDALFIGGTTAFKESEEAACWVRQAKERGKWVHMGRVNTERRVRYAERIGCDSVDGSKWARWRKTYLDEGLALLHQPQLALESVA